jgi:hypothetical protein
MNHARSKPLVPYPGQLMFRFMTDRRYGRRKSVAVQAQQEGPPAEGPGGRSERGGRRKAG